MKVGVSVTADTRESGGRVGVIAERSFWIKVVS